MKKQLLFISALGLAVSAFAATPLQSENNPEAVASTRSTDLKSIKFDGKIEAMQTMPLSAASTDAVEYAPSTDSLTAWFNMPAGCFYLGSLQGYWLNGLLDNKIMIPTQTELTWKGLIYRYDAAATFKTVEWGYEKQVKEGTSYDITQETTTTGNLVTPPYYSLRTSSGTYFPTAPTLTLNKDGEGSKPSSFNPAPVGGMFASLGTPRFNFGTSVGVRAVSYCEIDVNRVVDGNWSSKLTTASEDSVALVNFSNVKPGENYYTDAYMTRFGAYLEKPAKTFGLDSIVITGGFDSFKDEGIVVDIYEAEPVAGKILYTLGKRIGGGFLPAEKVRVDPGYIYPTVIPMTDEEGEPSFVNIDTNVIILVGGFSTKNGSTMSLYQFVAPYTKTEAGAYTSVKSSPLTSLHNCVIEIADETGVIDVRYVTPGSSNANKINFRGIGWFMQYYGGYTTLGVEDEPEGTFDMEVGAEGGEKEFTFNPYYDLSTDGKFTGEGANDWVLFEVGDPDLVDYSQTVTVMVDPLPEGVSSRETTVYVEISGAKQAINIKQGGTSAINEVGADSEVVATEYFDLQGRALKAAPEAGLYLKKEVRANGNVSTVKVAE